jgi:hypothetical protein
VEHDETDNKDFRNPFPKASAILRQEAGGHGGQIAPMSRQQECACGPQGDATS